MALGQNLTVERDHDVPTGEVWVHCAGGYRASIAASFLAAAGRDLVAIDDSFDRAAPAGLPVVGPTVDPAVNDR